MSEMTDDIFKKTRAGLDYMEWRLKNYEKEIAHHEKEIAQLKRDIQILTEELAHERRPKMDER